MVPVSLVLHELPTVTTATTTVTIQNSLGMHARPAMLFSEIAGKYRCEIKVSHTDIDPVDAKSIMQLMMLAATQGTELIITANGGDANEAVEELATLVTTGFSE